MRALWLIFRGVPSLTSAHISLRGVSAIRGTNIILFLAYQPNRPYQTESPDHGRQLLADASEAFSSGHAFYRVPVYGQLDGENGPNDVEEVKDSKEVERSSGSERD
jgi:hypothetical protein